MEGTGTSFRLVTSAATLMKAVCLSAVKRSGVDDRLSMRSAAKYD
jgi:hypothetical protein